MAAEGPCPVCHNAARLSPTDEEAWEVACPRCATYRITGTAEQILQAEPLADDEWVRVSGRLREAALSEPPSVLTTERLMYYRTAAMPGEDEKCRRLLLHLVRTTQPGELISIDAGDPALQGIAWAADADEAIYLLMSRMRDALGWLDPAVTTRGPGRKLRARISEQGREAATGGA